MPRIVMTGGTAGIGRAVAEMIRGDPGVRLLVGVRGAVVGPAETAPLDLARLASVRAFAEAVGRWLGEAGTIDALVLNAGTQVRSIDLRTEDGFETTFAVNHLAHYLLLRLLAPKLGKGARVVITTSNLHDPNTNPLAPPAHADADKLSRGEATLSSGTKDGMAVMRAYAASKLCNVLTARAFADSALARRRGLRVVAFNPGFTPGTQLTRNHTLVFRVMSGMISSVIGVFQWRNTVAGGGKLLADLALGRIVPPDGRFYASQVRRTLTWPDTSAIAHDDVVMAKLWHDSATMVGLPTSE